MEKKEKISSSSNFLRLLQSFILSFPFLMIILVNIVSNNLGVFLKFGFVFFSIIYFVLLYFGFRFFLFDWDLYKVDGKLILKNILGKQKVIDKNEVRDIEIKKTVLSISFYFKIKNKNTEYIVRYFPNKKRIHKYFDKENVIEKFKNELEVCKNEPTI